MIITIKSIDYLLQHCCFFSPSSIEMPILIGMRELRAFFQRVNVKLSNAKLKELIQVRCKNVMIQGIEKVILVQ